MPKLEALGMPTPGVAVYPVPGIGSTARTVMYLAFDGMDTVDAWAALQRLEHGTYRSIIDERNAVWARFRHWVAELERNEWHHGWPDDPEFPMGYVFKWDDRRSQHRRLYGFLASPRPRFKVCVLCCYRAKDTHGTDDEVKRTVRTMSQHAEVKKALKHVFGRKRGKPWNVH